MTSRHTSLTKTIVEKTLPDPTRDVFVWDTKVPGFGVRIFPSGKRKYVFQYRTKSRQQRRVVIGAHGAWTTEKARDYAGDLYEVVRKGGDPVHDQKVAAMRRRDAFEVVAAEFIAKYLRQKGRAQSYINDTEAMFEKHVVPRWRGRDLTSITRRDVTDLLDKIVEAGRPIAANRVLAAIRKLFNWALQRGIVEANPASLIERPGKETRRERVLSGDEVSSVWPHLDTLGYPFGSFLKMVLATGQRRDEVANMRWQDIDETERTWTLPSALTKAGRSHIVPLSPLAVEILAQAKRDRAAKKLAPDDSASESATPEVYVFTTTGDRPISGYSKVKARLDAVLAKDRAAANQDPMEPWTIHDLRRTVATGLGRLGTPRFVIARVLNHADRSVTGIYDKYEYLPEKRNALDRWGLYLGNLIALPSSNVVPLRSAVG